MPTYLPCPACGAPLLEQELPVEHGRPCATCGATVHRPVTAEPWTISFDPRPVAAVHRRADLKEQAAR